MNKLLLKESIFFTIIAYGLAFLYILSVSYFILWNKQPTSYFYEFNGIILFYSILLMISDESIMKNVRNKIYKIKKKNKKPEKFKINDFVLIAQILTVIYTFLLTSLMIIYYDSLFALQISPLLLFTITILKSIIRPLNRKIEMDYPNNCLYLDKEKILFEDIKEYSVETENIISKCTIYLENNSEIIYYELMHQNDFKSSLIKNLRYLKIPEKYVD